MKSGFAIALLSIAMVCASAVAQEMTAEGWYKTSQELSKNGSYEESVKALNRAIELDSRNATL